MYTILKKDSPKDEKHFKVPDAFTYGFPLIDFQYICSGKEKKKNE